MAEHQLNDADVDAIGEEATRAFVPQVVPSQIDLSQLLLVLLDGRPWFLQLTSNPRLSSSSVTFR